MGLMKHDIVGAFFIAPLKYAWETEYAHFNASGAHFTTLIFLQYVFKDPF